MRIVKDRNGLATDSLTVEVFSYTIYTKNTNLLEKGKIFDLLACNEWIEMK